MKIVDIANNSLPEYMEDFIEHETWYPKSPNSEVQQEIIRIDGTDEAVKISYLMDREQQGSWIRSISYEPEAQVAFIRKGGKLIVVQLGDGISACGAGEEKVGDRISFRIGDREVFERILATLKLLW